MEYSKMTTKQLQQESLKLNKKRMAARAEMKAIAVELDRRAAQKKLDTMSDAEKDNLRQLLGPGGIATEEAVGEPGV